ncbi:zinc metallochaperone AztD [Gordonia sp. CPCC 205333]|uniref:zinc metallochaperone AztD n=1 Tax=Gordonia sp. CPCC 205333 TaxID=3140790 RepID=UPI003AF38337
MRVLNMKRIAVVVAALAIPALASCGTSAESSAPSASSKAPVEESSKTPRLAVSYDGGIVVLDADDLGQVADIPLDGFLRLNSAANGRNVFVSVSDGFRVLDMGTWTRQHGDHGHYYTSTPNMTDLKFGGAEPGHVVPHDSRITLFSDGTGEVTVVEPVDLARGTASATSFTVPQPHHGVAVARGDGAVVVTVGNEDKRTGLAVLDKNRNEIARTDECPGVHGEAAAAGGVLTFGCENGIVVLRGNTFTKIASADSYGRIGNQAGAPDSPVVLGDYKTQRPSKDENDTSIERPRRFTLTDTAANAIRVVDLPTSYSFRSLERGPNGTAVILGTDGALYRFDAATGRQLSRVDVIAPWTEPEEWQSAMPNLFVQGSTAYVSDPNTRTLIAVDLSSGKKIAETTLPQRAIELTGVTG